ncbi:hypothetical protein GGS20DRAFT_21701 [Poronia punctata]|nr:hypothetical protein GGS20DRAFT_21701 [Poronia punctata]
MSPQFPSIQSFYSREVTSSGLCNGTGLRTTCDGFTSSEIEVVTKPLSRPFRPTRNYEVCNIGDLETGPHDYVVTGRLVNFSSTGGSHKNPGDYHFLLVSDASGVLAVKLHCNNQEYHPLLGQRITVWATSISAGNQAEIGPIPYCFAATTIYPGRDGATHIMFHVDAPESEEYFSLRVPLEVDIGSYEQLPGLMTLKSFLASGYDLGEGKILGCVRSIGPRRTVHSKKKESNCHLVEVGIYDDTATCVLTLWEDMIASAKLWVPNQTVLLVSQPFGRAINRRGDARVDVGIGYSSLVNIDPDIPEARWLRTKIQEMAKRDSVCITFPQNIWDLQHAMYGPRRTLYTLGEVEDQVRTHRGNSENFTGKLSVVVLEMRLMDHWRKATTFCIECCGIPLYSNKLTATCKNCDSCHELSVNSRIVGSFVDESGMTTGNKLVWNPQAWTEFFFGRMSKPGSVDYGPKQVAERSQRTWSNIAAMDTNLLRDLEADLLYSRVTLTFGWSIEHKRLCVLGVEW